MSTELHDKRCLFTKLLPRLIDKMVEAGRSPMLGADGLKHMAGSLHFLGLAVDILLSDGKGGLIEDPEIYRPFCEYWKSLAKDCRCGADFQSVDLDHFSVTFQGRS